MFIGREQELRDLNAFRGRDHGVLITCGGRRRIGKSTFIAEFARHSTTMVAFRLPFRRIVTSISSFRPKAFSTSPSFNS